MRAGSARFGAANMASNCSAGSSSTKLDERLKGRSAKPPRGFPRLENRTQKRAPWARSSEFFSLADLNFRVNNQRIDGFTQWMIYSAVLQNT